MKKKLLTLLIVFSVFLGGIANAQEKAARISIDTSSELFSAKSFEKGQPGFKTDNPILNGNLRNSSKAVIFETDFSEGIAGWNTYGLGATNWAINSSNYAGGVAPELRFNWTPSFTGASYFTSPVINTEGYTALTLEYKHMLDNYNTTNKTIGVATTIDNGANWLIAWSQVVAGGDITAEVKSITIDNVHVGNANFRFAFFFDGYTFNIDYYYIDDVVLGQPEEHDLGVIAIAPTFVMSGNTVTPKVTLKNFGLNAESIWSVTLTDGNGYTSTKTDVATIDPNTTLVVEMDNWTPADGTYTLTATVTLASDSYLDNNEMSVDVNVSGYSIAYGGNTTDGVYNSVDLSNGNMTPIGTIVTTPFPMAEEYIGTIIYRIYNNMTYGTVTPDGVYTQVGTMSGVIGTPTALTWDWNNGVMYVLILNASNYPVLCTLNLTTGVLTQVGITDEAIMIIGMDFANDGFIYGPSISPDNLYKIDPSDGSITEIGPLGVDINYGQDVSFDPEAEMLYTITTGGVYAFGTYDLSTGAFTSIAPTGDKQYGTFVITKSGYVEGAMITFVVEDSDDFVSEALVSIGSRSVLTNASGEVTLFVREGENIPYNVYKFGYQLYEGTITVVDEVDDTEYVILTKLPEYSVDIFVEDLGENPIEGAEVIIYFNGLEITSEITDEFGEASFILPSGTYTYDILMLGYESILDTELILDEDLVLYVYLVEVMMTPYALTIVIDEVEGSALLKWNQGETYFTDSFEDGTLNAWEFIQGAGTPGDGGYSYWHATDDVDGVTAPHGTFVCKADWGYNINTWIISPQISISEGASIIFNWYSSYYWSVSPYPNAQLLVKVSTDNGTTWSTPLWNWQEIGTWTNFTWYETTLPLASYQGQLIKVAFQLVADDNAVTQIDNIRIGVADKAGTVAIYKTPRLTKDAKAAGSFKSSEKVLEGYNVFLNNMENPIGFINDGEDTEYIFTDLEVGDYTAGVSAVYTYTETEIATIEFIFGQTYSVTFSVDGGNGILTASVNGNSITSGDSFIEGTDIEFTATPDSGYKLKNWKLNDDVISHTENIYTYSNLDADVNVKVEFEVITNIEDFVIAGINIYPNPARNATTIVSDVYIKEISVINIIGDIVADYNVNAKQYNLNISNISKGVYFLKITTENGIVTKRLLVN